MEEKKGIIEYHGADVVGSVYNLYLELPIEFWNCNGKPNFKFSHTGILVYRYG